MHTVDTVSGVQHNDENERDAVNRRSIHFCGGQRTSVTQTEILASATDKAEVATLGDPGLGARGFSWAVTWSTGFETLSPGPSARCPRQICCAYALTKREVNR